VVALRSSPISFEKSQPCDERCLESVSLRCLFSQPRPQHSLSDLMDGHFKPTAATWHQPLRPLLRFCRHRRHQKQILLLLLPHPRLLLLQHPYQLLLSSRPGNLVTLSQSARRSRLLAWSRGIGNVSYAERLGSRSRNPKGLSRNPVQDRIDSHRYADAADLRNDLQGVRPERL
jgi:hypothetical protein